MTTAFRLLIGALLAVLFSVMFPAEVHTPGGVVQVRAALAQPGAR